MQSANHIQSAGNGYARFQIYATQPLLNECAREFVRDHHPLAVVLLGGSGLGTAALAVFALGEGQFATAMVPLLAILSMAFNALFWTYGRVLLSPVEGMDATLADVFEFVAQGREVIDMRRSSGLEIRGFDLWMALVLHMRASGHR